MEHGRAAGRVVFGAKRQSAQGAQPHPVVGILNGQTGQHCPGADGSLGPTSGGGSQSSLQCRNSAQRARRRRPHSVGAVFHSHPQQSSFGQSRQVGIESAGAQQAHRGRQPAASRQPGRVQHQHRAPNALGRAEAAQGGAAQTPGQSGGTGGIVPGFSAPQLGQAAPGHGSAQGFVHVAAHLAVVFLQHARAQAVHGSTIAGLAQGIGRGAAHTGIGITQQGQQAGHSRRGLHRGQRQGGLAAINRAGAT